MKRRRMLSLAVALCAGGAAPGERVGGVRRDGRLTIMPTQRPLTLARRPAGY